MLERMEIAKKILEAQERGLSRQRVSQLRHPDRTRARQKFADALRRGDISRPSHCSRCAAACVPHGHHEDYSKPLEVIWLCPACHGQTRAGVPANRYVVPRRPQKTRPSQPPITEEELNDARKRLRERYPFLWEK